MTSFSLLQVLILCYQYYLYKTNITDNKSKNALKNIKKQSLFRIDINQNDTTGNSESEITDDDILDEDLLNIKTIEMISNPIHNISKNKDNDDDDDDNNDNDNDEVIEVII
jgi:hypothetical protein